MLCEERYEPYKSTILVFGLPFSYHGKMCYKNCRKSKKTPFLMAALRAYGYYLGFKDEKFFEL